MGNNYFNDDYECYECGAKMEKADEEVLVCPVCGHSVDIEDYLTEGEDYEQLSRGRSGYDGLACWRDNEEFPGENYDDIYGNKK